jgi:hypothetical protein
MAREKVVKWTDHKGREREDRLRYCGKCREWHRLDAQGKPHTHGSLGWACDTITYRKW